MTTLTWILLSTLLMSLFAFAGALTLIFSEKNLKKLTLPLVSFSTGALLGGAFLHLLPQAIESHENHLNIFVWVLIGFATFFILEQFINWHHCHRSPSEHKHPVTYLILLGDGIHNFIDGIVIAGAFLIDIRLGVVTWMVTATHEIPQELGDFGIMIHGGWSKAKALLFNFLSGLTMVVGGILTFFFSSQINTVLLLAFAAGNFIYIGASDLIPEIKHYTSIKRNIIHSTIFFAAILLLFAIKVLSG